MGLRALELRDWALLGFLGVALVLGGGGSPSPWAELAVQGAAALFVLLLAAIGSRGPERVPRALWWIAALVLALPLLQLVPLPPEIWQTLPGRDLAARSLELVGEGDSWRPISVASQRTLAALLACVPPLVAMCAIAASGERTRRAVLALVAGFAVFTAILGALQLLVPEGELRLYPAYHTGWLTGTFANRNAAVDVLLIGLLAGIAWAALRARETRRAKVAWVPLAAFALVVLAAAVLTGSRAGIALVVPTLAAVLWMLREHWRGGRTRSLAFGGAGLIALAAALLVTGTLGRVASVAERFTLTRDARVDLWIDAQAALAAYWPVGSGMGTFTRAFMAYERLGAVDPTVPNRAHNEYLELGIEAGLSGFVVLLAIAALLAGLARSGWAAGSAHRPILLFAGATLVLICLHAFVDYPLRNMAEACLAGVAAGMLAPPARGRVG